MMEFKTSLLFANYNYYNGFNGNNFKLPLTLKYTHVFVPIGFQIIN